MTDLISIVVGAAVVGSLAALAFTIHFLVGVAYDSIGVGYVLTGCGLAFCWLLGTLLRMLVDW